VSGHVRHAAGLALSPPAPLATLAERYGGTVDPEARSFLVERIAPLDAASENDLCPLTARRSAADAERASKLPRVWFLVATELADLVPRGRRWVHPHATWALAGLLADLVVPTEPRIHERALVDADARVEPSVSIGPGAIVMAGVHIGRASVLEPHAVIYPGVRMGERVVVGAGAVIGRPGFGWAKGPGSEVRRVPQLGGVWIEDDVEIGPLATVDAGTLGPTVLERGVRLDAHVHVGHNGRIGAGTFVAAQSGFAGSVRIGTEVRIGGQVGIADHVRIGDRAAIAAKAGVIGDIPSGRTVAGYPAVNRIRWLRGMARLLGAGRKGP